MFVAAEHMPHCEDISIAPPQGPQSPTTLASEVLPPSDLPPTARPPWHFPAQGMRAELAPAVASRPVSRDAWSAPTAPPSAPEGVAKAAGTPAPYEETLVEMVEGKRADEGGGPRGGVRASGGLAPGSLEFEGSSLQFTERDGSESYSPSKYGECVISSDGKTPLPLRADKKVEAHRRKVLARHLGKRSVKGLKLESVAAVATVAHFVDRTDRYRWRGPYEYWTRVTLAWTFNLTLNFCCCIISLTFGVVKFKGNATSFMLLGWFFAAGQTYLIIEPLQVCLIVCAPFLFDEGNACGRCCLRIRYTYNEIFAP